MENSCRWDRAALKSYRFKPMLKFQGFRWLLREAVPGLRPDLIFSRKPGTETLRILTPRSQDEKKKTPRGDENLSRTTPHPRRYRIMKKRRPREGTKTALQSSQCSTSFTNEKKKTPRGDENRKRKLLHCQHMSNEKKKTPRGDENSDIRSQLTLLLLHEKKKTPRGDENSRQSHAPSRVSRSRMKKRRPREGTKTISISVNDFFVHDEKKKTPRGDENHFGSGSPVRIFTCMKKRRPREGTKTISRYNFCAFVKFMKKRRPREGTKTC